MDIDDSSISSIYFYGVTEMSFNWCHGPNCHTTETVDRVRGSKGNKVLRTRKVKQTNWNEGYWYGYFCSQRCYDVYSNTHIQQIIAIAPRREALETPIEDPIKEKHSNEWHSWTNTKIKKKGVDNI